MCSSSDGSDVMPLLPQLLVPAVVIVIILLFLLLLQDLTPSAHTIDYQNYLCEY